MRRINAIRDFRNRHSGTIYAGDEEEEGRGVYRKPAAVSRKELLPVVVCLILKVTYRRIDREIDSNGLSRG